MKVHQGVENFPKAAYAVVTIGTFDGVHIGHQKILKRLAEIAKENNGETVLITFWPHPRYILESGSAFKLLTTIEEKSALLQAYGINHLVRIAFTKEFSQLSSEEFIQEILIKRIGTKKLVIGYDHRFGKNREGSFEYLVNNSTLYGFEVEEIPRQDIDNIGVSSTKIRHAIETGTVEVAHEYLGRYYSVTGTVVRGKMLGRTIGYPTANIQVAEDYKLIPADGIYAVRVEYNEVAYGGMLSIGYNPTVNGTARTIEVNIFDFDEEIYGKRLTIYFVAWLRNEEKFDNLEQLKRQLAIDKENSLLLLSQQP